MSQCGFLGRLKTCVKGPKTRHKCGLPHMRTGRGAHTIHECKHCKTTFGSTDMPVARAVAPA